MTLAVAARPATASPAAQSLTISPASPYQLRHTSLTFTARLERRGRLPIDVTNSVRWSSSNPTVARFAAGSRASLLAQGQTTISARLHGTLRASTSLTVTVAQAPVFTQQPSDTDVGAVIDSPDGVAVQLVDDLNHPLAGLDVTIAIGTNAAVGGTGTLTGTLTQATDLLGVATFPDLKLDWVGTGYTLAASAQPRSGAVAAASNAFDAVRVGEACLGPSDPGGERPVCVAPTDPLYCADTDVDGLNDAWETAGGVDLNGDGVISDAAHDLLLAGADAAAPDLYVYYDWMDYGPDDRTCSTDLNCRAYGRYHRGETCDTSGQCLYACGTDADCTTGTTNACSSNSDCASGSICDTASGECTRGSWHAGEHCVASVCQHTHDPLALDPNTFQPVIDRFSAHGIALHVLRGTAQPHSHVVSYRSSGQMTLGCEGASLASGGVGLGKYAVSFYDLKGLSNPDHFLTAYHYALFSHYSGCDSKAHCPADLGNSSNCLEPGLSFGQAGYAEKDGNDLIVSLGAPINDTGLPPHVLASSNFMHELGHNLGMNHDGHKDEPCDPEADACPSGESCVDDLKGEGPVCRELVEEPNYKPNYLSVMNYRYERDGIPLAATIGGHALVPCSTDDDCGAGALCVAALWPTLSNCSTSGYVCAVDGDCTLPGETCRPTASHCARLDYSAQTLPAAGPVPGALDESDLDDTAGLGSGTRDLFLYVDALCHTCPRLAPTTGPVNWGGDGVYTDPGCNVYSVGAEVLDATGVQADVDSSNGVCDSVPADVLHGVTDWPDAGGLPFVYKFQCNANGSN